VSIFTLKGYKKIRKLLKFQDVMLNGFKFIGIQYGLKSNLHLYNCKFCGSTRSLFKEELNVSK
jgi:hypothetical protein